MAKKSVPRAICRAPPSANDLLARLPAVELERLSLSLQSVELAPGLMLYDQNERIGYVYFPTSGLVSSIVVSHDGAVEVASVGNEGLVGVCALLDADAMPMPTRALVTSAGHAWRLEVAAFREAVDASESMRQLFSRYTLSYLNQVAHMAACNRLHSLESRCARWLLMAHDRADGDDLLLTQETLAEMLGVHRPAVTLAARVFQKAGFIDYSRGRISIVDRSGLESAACACYASVKADFESLLGHATVSL